MIQNFLNKVDNIITYVLVTIMFWFPIVRLIAALRGTVVVSFDAIMMVFAAGYLAWFIYVEVWPMLATIRNPSDVHPNYTRWLSLFFVLPWVVPYFRINNSSAVSENAIATSALVVGMAYMVVAYKYGARWPKDYLATTFGYLHLVKNYAQPLVLDVLMNDKKKVVAPAKAAAAPSTKGQNTTNKQPVVPVMPLSTTPVRATEQSGTQSTTRQVQVPTAEKPVVPPAPPVPVQKKVELPAAVFAAVSPAASTAQVPTVEELIADSDDDMKAVETFVAMVGKQDGNIINSSAFKLKTGDYTNFGVFRQLVRDDANKAFGIYLGWLDEARGQQFRSEARKALGLS